MRNKLFISLILVFFLISISLAGNIKDNKSLSKPNTLGLVERMDINNIDLPILNNGSTGEDGQAYYPSGQTDRSFLYQGGIATSGYVNIWNPVDSVWVRQLRASWMAAASLIEEWQPGTWGMDPTDTRARFYVVNKADGPGSQAYRDWADAVALGADYQDLDSSGTYDPYIDAPDMIGDRIIWCPINDQTTIAQRTPRLGTDPLGLEVHMMVFAFARSDRLGDVVFIRYRFLNTNDSTDIEDMIFSIWEDPDIGDADDDLVGCDTTVSLGYCFNDNDGDADYGINPPAHGIDFFQGPLVPAAVTDTAYLYRGPFFGIDTVPGMRNLPMTSFMWYINGDPDLTDPTNATIARYYQTGGLDATGDTLIPGNWGIGGAGANPKFVYSGDPVAGTGWLDNTPDDKRMQVNCGPFQLAAGEVQDIVIGYIVAQDVDGLTALHELQTTDTVAQAAYDANFLIAGPPPPPKVTARTFDNEIELIIDLEANGTKEYDFTDPVGNRMVFEAVEVYQLFSENPGDIVGTTENAIVIQRYDLDNQYAELYSEQPNGTIDKLWNGYSNLDTLAFADSGASTIRLTIDSDAFNSDNPLVNNTEYYFAVQVYAVNYNGVRQYLGGSGPNSYIMTGNAHFLSSNRNAALISVTPTNSEFVPFRGDSATYTGSRSVHEGKVFFDIIEHDSIRNHEYMITFSDDGELWYLHDLTIPDTLLDSMTFQAESPEEWNFPIFHGISAQVVNVPDMLDTALVTSGVSWITGFRDAGFDTVTATFNEGIEFAKYGRDDFGITFTKDRYAPVRIEFDTTFVSKGYQYLANYTFFRGIQDLRLRAYDVSDESNPRQVNIAYISPTPELNFTAGDVMIMMSDYDSLGAYISGRDSAFLADAYLVIELRPDSGLLYSSQFDLTVFPRYPNSDMDEYRINTENLMTPLTTSQRKDLLKHVRVVPNPYFAYSRYETSYDNPRVKFTHLDRIATIRIFNLAGQLVRTIEKNDNINGVTNEIFWDLRNESGLKIASGMYIAHVEVPGVGSKIIKFGILQREERIDRF